MQKNPPVTRVFLGISLIESVAVIAIIGILSAIAFPKFINEVSFNERMFVLDAISSLRYAQRVALGMGCDVEVIISNDTLSLYTRQNCINGNFTKPIILPTDRESVFAKPIPENIKVITNNFPIYFDRSGKTRRVSDNKIINPDVTFNNRKITIVGTTGFVSEAGD